MLSLDLVHKNYSSFIFLFEIEKKLLRKSYCVVRDVDLLFPVTFINSGRQDTTGEPPNMIYLRVIFLLREWLTYVDMPYD